MPEKTLKSNKRIILLRSFSLVCALAVLLSCMTFFAAAAPINYRDLDYTVTVDGDNDIVTVALPVDLTRFIVYNDAWQIVADRVSQNVGINGIGYSMSKISCEVLSGSGLSISNIPVDTKVTFNFNFDYDLLEIDGGTLSVHLRYLDSSGAVLENEIFSLGNHPIGLFSAEFILSSVPSASAVFPTVWWYPEFHSPDSHAFIDWTINSVQLTMSISSLYRLQEETGRTNELLDEVNRQLEEQGKTMDDILAEQEQTNDKLDQLPGQIGDEMQGVIESEKEESKSEGNKFVDQILDALPDPSSDVLAALKSLTDATAYTGTDAVLPIPAIVLPGIDGLFPETVIWEGTEFDFGDYLGFIPSSLLTLVQSLFTIAIVLFCVYELKGIISYCLTLRESKGG